MNRLGLYVQIPFCASKCSFCNFSSTVSPAKTVSDYVASLESEIELLPLESGEPANTHSRIPTSLLKLPVDSVYLGGGTPTLLGAEGLTRLFAALHSRFQFDAQAEITIEMTPGSADHELLTACRALGINRLSIGAQSFDDRELRSVGRLHSGAETIDQVRLARQVGFANISLDLIAGLPYQTEASWLGSLRQALDLAPEHLSIYLFEVDEKSRLGNEVLLHGDRYHAGYVPSEESMAEAYEKAREMLSEAGYVQYEISNFARPACESRHNRKYWTLEPYLGLGAGAHSFDGQARWSNEVSTVDYAARIVLEELPIVDWRPLGEAERMEEFFFLGLRQREGVDLEQAASRWGSAAADSWRPRIDSLVGDGLLERRDRWLRLTPRAYLVSNEVFQEFLA